jgi:hypothetical protein
MSTHLRGRVRYAGHRALGERVWLIEVVNVTTGRVVHTDDTCDLSTCCDYAKEHVEVARVAWIMGLRRGDLQPKWRAS